MHTDCVPPLGVPARPAVPAASAASASRLHPFAGCAQACCFQPLRFSSRSSIVPKPGSRPVRLHPSSLRSGFASQTKRFTLRVPLFSLFFLFRSAIGSDLWSYVSSAPPRGRFATAPSGAPLLVSRLRSFCENREYCDSRTHSVGARSAINKRFPIWPKWPTQKLVSSCCAG